MQVEILDKVLDYFTSNMDMKLYAPNQLVENYIDQETVGNMYDIFINIYDYAIKNGEFPYPIPYSGMRWSKEFHIQNLMAMHYNRFFNESRGIYGLDYLFESTENASSSESTENESN